MTTTHHPKTIVAAIVAGALALAAPAGASVLNPITDSWNQGSPYVQTVNATYQPSSGGDGFDFGSAAVGGGAVLLLACLAMMGSSAIGGRRSSQPKPGTAIQAA